MRPLPWILLAVLATWIPRPAAATTLVVSFTGTISSLNAALSSGFTVGDAVSGSLQIDAATVDSHGSPLLGVYDNAHDIQFTFGSYSVSEPGGNGNLSQVTVGNETNDTFDEVVSTSGPAVGGFAFTSFQLRMIDTDATAFSSDALPTSLNLADFETRVAFLNFFQNPNFAVVSATLDTLSITVPEPGSVALLALAVGLVVRRARHSGV